MLGFDLVAAEAGELVVAHKLFYTAPGRDKYGRWLIHLELEPGLMANGAQVEQGHAIYRAY